MKALVVTLLLITAAPATAQRNLDFGPPTRTIKLYDKDKTTQIATATFSGRAIYFRNMKGEHIATLARNPDNTIGAWDPHGKPIDPKVLPSLERNDDPR